MRNRSHQPASRPARSQRAGSLSGARHELAICSAASADAGVALAACAFALPAPGDGNTIEIQLTPSGEFTPSDGREMKVRAWRIDRDIAARAIAATTAMKNPPVIDYEHQTLRKEENGQPAPAAGWMRGFAWREGKGLFATVELTQRAKQYIADGEYRFVSPVFTYDPTGAVTSIRMAALTNTPAIDGMEPLALRAAATFGHHLHEDTSMKKLIPALVAISLFGLAADATEDQAVAALNAAKPKLDGLGDFAKALGLKADAKLEDLVAACTSLKANSDAAAGMRKALGIADNVAGDTAIAACTTLKAKADGAGGNPDPSQYVSVATFEALKSDFAALTAKLQGSDVEQLVQGGLKDGRLLPAQADWARDLGKKDVAALTAYLEKTPSIAALTSTQTRGAPPPDASTNAHGLTPDELAVCTNTGVAPEEFAKAKKAIAA
jgi:phage I-like protein